jgi:hypothetical protein
MPAAPLFFCNIGWMARYKGNEGQPDKIVGGGRYVREHGAGGEVCNFLAADDGFVYGHVETIKGEIDRRINLRRLGAESESAEGVDVVWTATNPDGSGRFVVGWYRNAIVFAKRQELLSSSKQHRRDHLRDYRMKVRAEDAHCLEPDNRTLALGRGPGWMGHTPWWIPEDNPRRDVREFVARVKQLINEDATPAKTEKGNSRNDNSPGAATDPYVRYVSAYEAAISPRHDKLQQRFQKHLQTKGASELAPNQSRVDLRFRDAERGLVLTEIKPCDKATVRFAIRTAMGQLLDYRQKANRTCGLLVVVEVEPGRDEQTLATSNGFGIAFPKGREFEIVWP